MINKNQDKDEFLILKTPLRVTLSSLLCCRALNKQHAPSLSHSITEVEVPNIFFLFFTE